MSKEPARSCQIKKFSVKLQSCFTLLTTASSKGCCLMISKHHNAIQYKGTHGDVILYTYSTVHRKNVSLLDIPCVSTWESLSVRWRLKQITQSDALQHQLSNSEHWDEQNFVPSVTLPASIQTKPSTLFTIQRITVSGCYYAIQFEFSLKWVGHSTQCLH